MIRRTWALAFMLVASAVALALALSGATSHATGAFAVPDPTGDTFGSAKGGTQHDIVLVSGSTDGTNLILTVEFANSISPPPGQGPARGLSRTNEPLGITPDAIVGYIDFDTDQDAATEEVATGKGGTSNVTTYCPVASGMGIEAYLSFDGYDAGAGTTSLMTAAGPVAVPIAFAVNSFTATIPISELGGDLSFNFGMVIGNMEEPTDCFPGDGGFFKPNLEKATPTPTATSAPAATETAPAPTSTVAAAVSLPETGHGPSGDTPTPLWALLGAGAVASAAAAIWTTRRRRT